ncbi:hypothetical protein PG999_007531 [Apiospora kogelbergensis]|uniref:2EXR domain-containing protein n=1 Tax=Apiospora kogelbergensis TaxID=1337665 RepID=A0AAW0QNA4_9PEZI
MASTYPTSIFEAPLSYSVPRDTGFPFFPKLPIELRRLIWTTCLQQQRIIKINIAPETGSGGRYTVEAASRYRHSKLLRICHEARTAALGFFSLRIPCANLDTLVPLYFSPEFDVLHINQRPYEGLGWLVDLLPKLTTYDSRGGGVLNLAIDHHVLSTVPGNLKGIKKPARKAFADAVSRLRQLWGMFIEQANTRAMAGGLDWLDAKVHHNRAVPIFPSLQTFTRLPGLDPRPIEMDLGHLATFHHPQLLVNRWRQLEKELDISRKEPLDLRILLASDATYSSDTQAPVVDRTTAQKYLEEEDRRFKEDICPLFDEPVPYWGSIWTRKSGRICEEVFKTPLASGCLRRTRLMDCPITALHHLRGRET